MKGLIFSLICGLLLVGTAAHSEPHAHLLNLSEMVDKPEWTAPGTGTPWDIACDGVNIYLGWDTDICAGLQPPAVQFMWNWEINSLAGNTCLTDKPCLYGMYMPGMDVIMVNAETPRLFQYKIIVHEMVHYITDKTGTIPGRCADEEAARIVSDWAEGVEYDSGWQSHYGCSTTTP